MLEIGIVIAALIVFAVLGVFGMRYLEKQKSATPSHLVTVIRKLQGLADRLWDGCPRGDVLTVVKSGKVVHTVYVRKNRHPEKRCNFYLSIKNDKDNVYIYPETKVEDNLLRDLFWSKHRLIDDRYQEAMVDRLDKLVDSIES